MPTYILMGLSCSERQPAWRKWFGLGKAPCRCAMWDERLKLLFCTVSAPDYESAAQALGGTTANSILTAAYPPHIERGTYCPFKAGPRTIEVLSETHWWLRHHLAMGSPKRPSGEEISAGQASAFDNGMVVERDFDRLLDMRRAETAHDLLNDLYTALHGERSELYLIELPEAQPLKAESRPRNDASPADTQYADRD